MALLGALDMLSALVARRLCPGPALLSAQGTAAPKTPAQQTPAEALVAAKRDAARRRRIAANLTFASARGQAAEDMTECRGHRKGRELSV